MNFNSIFTNCGYFILRRSRDAVSSNKSEVHFYTILRSGRSLLFFLSLFSICSPSSVSLLAAYPLNEVVVSARAFFPDSGEWMNNSKINVNAHQEHHFSIFCLCQCLCASCWCLHAFASDKKIYKYTFSLAERDLKRIMTTLSATIATISWTTNSFVPSMCRDLVAVVAVIG